MADQGTIAGSPVLKIARVWRYGWVIKKQNKQKTLLFKLVDFKIDKSLLRTSIIERLLQSASMYSYLMMMRMIFVNN